MLDDFENSAWPGVRQGACHFLEQAGNLRPFAIAYNKLYFTTIGYLPEYRRVAEEVSIRSTSQITYETISGFEVPRVLMPAVESLFPDAFVRNMDFSSSEAQEKYRMRGWSFPEAWGVWSQQETADLHVALDASEQPLTMIITFHAFVTESHPEMRIAIHINGRLADAIIFTTGQDYQNWTYLLQPSEIKNNSSLHIGFEIASPRSPFELGLSADQRKLGVGLRNIRFAQAAC